MFKILNEQEVQESKEWARNNYVVGSEISQLWHPVVCKECELMNSEAEAEVRYINSQFDRLELDSIHPMSIKIYSIDGNTNLMNVTKEQVLAIRAILIA